MKTITFISSLLLLLSFACQSNHSELDPAKHRAQVDSAWTSNIAQKISPEELPLTIKEEIHNDELFQDLDISDITKVIKDNAIYYDMTFRDADGQLIMVFYDEKGEIVVP